MMLRIFALESCANVPASANEIGRATPELHYYPYTRNGEIVAYKVRLIENKRMWSVGDQKEVDLFGWEQAKIAGGKKLFICEGEVDAASLFQIMVDKAKGTQYADRVPAVVSLAHGAGNAFRDLSKCLAEIGKYFQEIVLVFDMDDAGKKAVDDVMRIIPKAKVANLPGKDVNECLMKGHGVAAYNAVIFNAETPKNTRIVNGKSIHQSSKKAPEWGAPWPWKCLTEATRGIRLGETVYLGAG